MQAMMLAAGMGKRLGKHTLHNTKCMLKVGGITLIERTVNALKTAGITKMVMVIGYEAEELKAFLQAIITGIDFEFIYNHEYAETNNIYSLFMAKDYLTRDDTILLESDLIYEPSLLKKIVDCEDKDLVAVAKYEHWMDGTVVKLTGTGYIADFFDKSDFLYGDTDKYYKTVNIYKFSKEFSSQQLLPFLNAYIDAYGKNHYYELVLKILAHIRKTGLKAFVLEDVRWYEIDDAYDLSIADTMFAEDSKILSSYERHFGGYWKFPGLIDFSYLVNPYYPSALMKEKLKFFYDSLLTEYPSGMNIQKITAGKMFKVNDEYILVGNGAAELISALGQIVSGNVLLHIPVFNEYIRCLKKCKPVAINSIENDFAFNTSQIIEKIPLVNCVALINPDNPSGAFINYKDMMVILDTCLHHGVTCIVDESFIDFTEKDEYYTLLSDSILEKYPNLIVLKSISKSYGVPGLRLGVMAASNKGILDKVLEHIPVWNINSFAEYFLQIAPLFAHDFKRSCNKLAFERKWLAAELSKLDFLKVYNSQANYILCKTTGELSSRELVTNVLKDAYLLLKDLSAKRGFNGDSFIRIAVRDRADNQRLIDYLCRYAGRHLQ